MAPNSAPSLSNTNALFDRIAKHYDNDWLQRWVYRTPQDAVLDELRTRGARRILDVGCGTGVMAARIQRELQPGEVIGVDPSEGMLANARARSSDVQWIHGVAEHLPLPDDSVDAVTSTTAFHFFDQPAALADFYRVLAPGGVVALATIGTTLPLPGPVQRLLMSKSSVKQHHPADTELQTMLSNAGFTVTRQGRVRPCSLPLAWFHTITIAVKPVH